MTDNTAASGQIGAGQQTPNDSADEANKIAFAVRRILAELDHMQPVQVVAVHAGSGTPPTPATVDVQPLVSRVDGNMNAVPEGTVYGIPCQRVQGGPWAIICDPAVGDFGYVVAADRDISRVKASPGVAAPGSSRRSSIADGVYAGAILNGAPEAYIWLKPDGTYVFSDKSGFVIKSNGDGTGTVMGDLILAGNFRLGGQVLAQDGTAYAQVIQALDFTTGTVALAEHIHQYTAPSSGGVPNINTSPAIG